MKRTSILVLLSVIFLAISCSVSRNQEKPAVLWVEASANFSRLETRDSIRHYIDKAKEAGFNGLMIDAKRVFGDVMYRSDLHPECKSHKGYVIENRGFDYLDFFIKEAKARKMRVSVALSIFPTGYPCKKEGLAFSDTSMSGFYCKEYLPEGIRDIRESENPNKFAFLSPVHPQVHDYVMNTVREIVSRYDFDGLVLDYCRWPDIHSDFSEAARVGFEKYCNQKVSRFPQDIYEYKGDNPDDYVPGPLFNKWLEWRASIIKNYVSDIRDCVKSVKPGVDIEYWAASWIWSLYGTGQNWADPESSWADSLWWGGKGYSAQGFGDRIDRFMLGAYLDRIYGPGIKGTAENAIAFAKKTISPRTTLYSSFQVTDKDYPAEDAAYLGYKETDGLMVFDLSDLVEQDAWSRVSNGIAKAKMQASGKRTANEEAAFRLAGRILPRHRNDFIFVEEGSEDDFFEIGSSGGKIVIKGNNANSMSVGLNYYLKNHCLTTISWHADEKVELPAELPGIPTPIRVKARLDKRFFLNYCTFGYTMPWWKWKDWERFIDWMALNGVNLPLATTGQEAVWQQVWKSYGLSDEQIRSYFTGPAHLPWHRMNNIDYWQGALPQSWIDSQAGLQKKILERERSLNMKPVLPAFAGHVPDAFAEMHPEASISDIPEWGGFDKKYLCHFLSPEDPLYSEIQKKFLDIQTDMFGTDHIYGMDLFNEVDAPAWTPERLASISEKAYSSLSGVDPSAVWLQMGWLFYADQRHWTPENMKAYLSAVPEGRLIMLDYYIEDTEVWKMTESFYGQDYILCYLGNFGGNTMLAGNFRETSRRIEECIGNGDANLTGIGSTLEGFGVNQFMYEFVLDKAWESPLTDDMWVEKLADRRAGMVDKDARAAWKALIDSIYIAPSITGQGTLTNAHPCFTGNWHWTTRNRIPYSPQTLESILSTMKKVRSDRYSWKYDVVNVSRQAIGDRFTLLRDSFTAAYRAKDLEKARETARDMVEVLDELERTVSEIDGFSLERWLEAARSFGRNKEERKYFEENARMIVTVWGDSKALTDYANRTWSGLVSSYYKKRWTMFLDKAISCLEQGKDFDQGAFDEEIREFEQSWVRNDNIR